MTLPSVAGSGATLALCLASSRLRSDARISLICGKPAHCRSSNSTRSCIALVLEAVSAASSDIRRNCSSMTLPSVAGSGATLALCLASSRLRSDARISLICGKPAHCRSSNSTRSCIALALEAVSAACTATRISSHWHSNFEVRLHMSS